MELPLKSYHLFFSLASQLLGNKIARLTRAKLRRCVLKISQWAEQASNKKSKSIGGTFVGRKNTVRSSRLNVYEILAKGLRIHLLSSSTSNQLGFPISLIQNSHWKIMLIHPTKVPSMGFDFILDFNSSYCDIHQKDEL